MIPPDLPRPLYDSRRTPDNAESHADRHGVVLGPDDATEYMVYHAWDRTRTMRRMCIDPIAWVMDPGSNIARPRCVGPTQGPRPLL